jgi:hypothetical protein
MYLSKRSVSTVLAVFGLVALVFAAVPASATTAVHLTTEEMVQTSDLIVTAHVVSSEAIWVDRTLVTVVTVAVDETVKGAPSSTVQVILPGGIDDSGPVPLGVTYAGAPTLYQDESAVLFLTRQDLLPAGYMVAGFSQGKLAIVDAPTGKKVQRDVSGLELTRGGRSVQVGATSVGLEEFLDGVRGMVAATSK